MRVNATDTFWHSHYAWRTDRILFAVENTVDDIQDVSLTTNSKMIKTRLPAAKDPKSERFQNLFFIFNRDSSLLPLLN